MFEEITIDFSYIDEYLNTIINKIKTNGTISMYNGYENILFFIDKTDNNETIIKYFDIIAKEDIIISYEDLVAEFMDLFKSSIGSVNVMYRVYVGQYNKNTEGEFRELWGDVLYVDPTNFKLKKQNIDSSHLGNVLIGIELTEEEIKYFGKPEDYIFMDENGEVIMGLDLI